MNESRRVQNSNLNIRLSKKLLESFEKACGERPKSIVLRMLMQNFVDENIESQTRQYIQNQKER